MCVWRDGDDDGDGDVFAFCSRALDTVTATPA